MLQVNRIFHFQLLFRYVHTAPDEPVDSQARVIRVPGNADKHVNIIFVKAPSASSQQQTEVILPEQGQQKTLVYVLTKRPESSSDVRIRGPSPTQPAKPEVYFIRYKNEGEEQAAGGNFGGAVGTFNSGSSGFSGSSNGGSLSTAYGAP